MTEELLGTIIGLVAVIGGLAIPITAIIVGSKTQVKENIAKIEALNKERLAMIEKGMDPSVIEIKTEPKSSHRPLLWGLLLTGVGFGWALAHFLDLKIMNMGNVFALFFGGLGLIIYYFYTKKRANQQAG